MVAIPYTCALQRVWETDVVSLVSQTIRWLARVPIADPLDRRNAPGFQILLFGAALMSLLVVLSAWNESGRFDWPVGVGLFCHAGLWFSFWLVRRGHFRAAVSLVFAGLLGLIVLSHQFYGLQVHSGLQVAHMLPLLLGGLLLGRAALWSGLVLLVLAVVLGGAVDLSHSVHDRFVHEDIRATMLLSALTFLVATVMLDRLISASRRALRRSEELDLAYQRLEQQMVENERAQEQLLQAKKVEVLGQLAGGIAHDFNNILGVILGYTEAAAQSGGGKSSAIAGIESAARRGMMATRRLLGLGSNRMQQVEVFDACIVVRRAMDLIRPLFRHRVNIRVDLPPEPMPVRLDRAELELALLNLATNARDAMVEDGEFRIAVSERDGMVEILVSDTGSGMRAEVAEQMFDPFFTTKSEGRGTGIGMAVVHRLIDDAGGRILVNSRLGEGTCISLLLPRMQMTENLPRMELTGTRVLLIEDEPQLRMLLTRALTESGCKVAVAGSGAQALEAIEDIGQAHMVVSDYRLPDIDGVSLLQGLRAYWPDAVSILITSHHADDRQLADNGIVLLTKPFVPAQLLDLMARQLRRTDSTPAAHDKAVG